MKTFPSDAVLLVIDLQNGFDHPSWGRRNNPDLELRIAELLRTWRACRAPVFHARHMSSVLDSPLRPGQHGNEFKSCAMPLPGEAVIEKRVNSCFIGTSLEADLRSRGLGTLVIAGLTTNHCVSTTARMAGNLGFLTWVVSDATATFDRIGPDGAVHSAELIQSVALSDIHEEFAMIIDTRAAIAAMRAHVIPVANEPLKFARRHR